MNLEMQQIVRAVPVAQSTPTPQPDLWTQIASFLPIFMVLVVVAVIGLIIIYLLKKKKEREKETIYKEDYYSIIDSCKKLKDPDYQKQILGIPKSIIARGVPIILNYPPTRPSRRYIESKIDIKTDPLKPTVIGRYRGHCNTMDGCINILVASTKHKVLFIFPRLFVIKLRKGVKKRVIDDNDKERKKVKTIDIPADSYNMSSEMIQIDCFGITPIGEFYYPVNIDKDGRIVDTRSFVYYDNIEVATQRQLIDFGNNMTRASEEMIRNNPWVQWAKKVEQESVRST